MLEVEGISKKFGGIRAVSNASLQIGAGEIHALIGPNGAGKTTLFNLVSGLFPPDGGTIRLNGRDIHGVPSHLICHHGLARSFQITNLFRGLSIYENLRLSLQSQHAMRFNIWRDIDSYPDVHAETAELIKFLGLEGIEEIEGGELSYGGQRLVDLGIALGSKPQVLLLDEPLAGLAAAERERVSNLIKNVAANIPVLIVEHDIDRVLGFSQRVTVMNQGEVLMAGTPGEVRERSPRAGNLHRLRHSTGHSGRFGRRRPARRCCASSASTPSMARAIFSTTRRWTCAKARSWRCSGRNGAGKSTLLKTLAGLVTPASGTIEYEGSDIAAHAGAGYRARGHRLRAAGARPVRRHDGAGKSRARPAGAQDRRQQAAWCGARSRSSTYFPRLKERMDIAADYLSGGEQQMVAVARALSGNVKLLLLDEPFEGLAPTVILELFKVFDLLRRHTSIVIVEHNLDLVLALADRVFALERGAVFHQGPAAPLLTDLEYRKKILWL